MRLKDADPFHLARYFVHTPRARSVAEKRRSLIGWNLADAEDSYRHTDV